MADIVKEIEITAAVSADYQNAFKAASGIARDSARELSALTKREADLQKLLDMSSRQAEASASGNAKAAEKLAASYDALAQKLGLVDKTAAGVSAELKEIGSRKKDVTALMTAAKRQESLGKLSKDIKSYSDAVKKFKDPALSKQLDALKKKFVSLGGSIPSEKKLSFFTKAKDALVGMPGPIGAVSKSFAGLGAVGAAAGVAAIGAAAVAAAKKMWDLGVSTASLGNQIAKTSQQLGISSDAFQELSWAVGLGGASEQDLASGLKSLNRQMASAVSGNAAAIKSFKRLGISLDEVKSMNAEEMFSRVSDALAGFEDVEDLTDVTDKLFGGGGAKLVNAIKGGSDALADMRKEARDAGYVLSKGDLAQAETVSDNIARAQMQLSAVTRELGVNALPVVNDVLTDFVQLMRDNRETIVEFAKGAGAAFKGVGSVLAIAMRAAVVATKVIQGGHEFWVSAFADFFSFADEKITWFSDAITSIPGRVSARVSEITAAVSRFVDDTVGYIYAIPDRVSNFFSGVLDSVSEWFSDIKGRAVSWVSGLIEDLKSYIMSGVRGLAGSLSQVPLIGRLFDGSAQVPAGGSGGVTINVQNSIDARGAAPGAGADVGRALSSAARPSGDSVASAFLRYSGLSYD